MVVYIHQQIPTEMGEYFTVLTRIAVPIFFMITGFFYDDVIKKNKEKLQIKKIIKLIIEANAIFLIFNIIYYGIREGQVLSFIQDAFSLKALIKLVFFSVSPIEGHLWYLNAILYVLVIAYFLNSRGIFKSLYYISPLLLTIGLIIGQYSVLLFGRDFSIVFSRNFCFVGIPFFCIGNAIRVYKERMFGRLNSKLLLIMVFLFVMMSFFEKYILNVYDLSSTGDLYISTLFLSVAVFLFTLSYKGKTSSGLAKVGRDISNWIYIIHPAFIKLFTIITEKLGIYEEYRMVAPTVVYIITVVFLNLLQRLRGRSHNENSSINSN